MKKFMENKRRLVACIALAMILFGMILTNATLSGYGDIERKNLYIAGTEGNVHAELFVPKDASAENKKPAVLLSTGGTGNLEVLENLCLELARRGYVTITYDPYQVSRTDTVDPPEDESDGGTTVYKHLISLDYVDTTQTALLGHSAGTGRILGIYNSGVNTDGIVALFGLGAVVRATPEMDINVGWCVGSFDLTSLPKTADDNAGLPTKNDEPLNGKTVVNTLIGQEPGSTYDYNTWYDTITGKQCIFYSGFFGHTLSFMVPASISKVMNFFTTVMPTGTSLSDNDLIYPWKTLGAIVALVGLIMLIFPIGSWLLDRKFFSSLKGEVPEPAGTANIQFWFFSSFLLSFRR